jgi:hypothetical protein
MHDAKSRRRAPQHTLLYVRMRAEHDDKVRHEKGPAYRRAPLR